jgi:hypothetical protein
MGLERVYDKGGRGRMKGVMDEGAKGTKRTVGQR